NSIFKILGFISVPVRLIIRFQLRLENTPVDCIAITFITGGYDINRINKSFRKSITIGMVIYHTDLGIYNIHIAHSGGMQIFIATFKAKTERFSIQYVGMFKIAAQ